MTEKKSTKATLVGVGASSLSLLGVCCGSGVCVVTCGVACATPIASILGISTAGLSAFNSNFLPVLTAISAVAFTIAYFSLYKKKEENCCDDDNVATVSSKRNRWIKPVFWVGLLLTIGFYTKVIAENYVPNDVCCEQTTSCAIVGAERSCNPSACLKK